MNWYKKWKIERLELEIARLTAKDEFYENNKLTDKGKETHCDIKEDIAVCKYKLDKLMKNSNNRSQ